MLGQHIKIMASIAADAPYIPIRGKGLRLISIASRYPSPGWKASERARAHAYARKENHGSAYVRYVIFALLFQRLVRVSRVSVLSRKNRPVSSLYVFYRTTLIFSLSASPIKLLLCFLRTRRRAIL